jgi:hypothetical protein
MLFFAFESFTSHRPGRNNTIYQRLKHHIINTTCFSQTMTQLRNRRSALHA